MYWRRQRLELIARRREQQDGKGWLWRCRWQQEHHSLWSVDNVRRLHFHIEYLLVVSNSIMLHLYPKICQCSVCLWLKLLCLAYSSSTCVDIFIMYNIMIHIYDMNVTIHIYFAESLVVCSYRLDMCCMYVIWHDTCLVYSFMFSVKINLWQISHDLFVQHSIAAASPMSQWHAANQDAKASDPDVFRHRICCVACIVLSAFSVLQGSYEWFPLVTCLSIIMEIEK